ncbi:Bro-N domain-containing protein [Pseudoramibacter alactolyticus]|uniref:BRO-N domain-containing protein n=1 Tax=Pseudoramibacter alactolyticus TaxID=113287 RepID=UPI0028E2F7B1|nr:Bro-N domain-containing protein [Pseudoramibacter alactolyticus]
MSNLKIFKNKEFGQLRTTMIDGEPWFVAKDVCDALELSNVTATIQRLEEDERAKFNLGRQGNTNFVNEFGIYSLVLSSRKKEAKRPKLLGRARHTLSIAF